MREQRWWTWHVASGVVILVLLGIHMVTMHLDALIGLSNPAGGAPIGWANVAARAKSLAFMVSYVLLLATALFHGLYGFRNIIAELNIGAGAKKAVGSLLLVAGLGLFVVGTWAAWATYGLAQTL